MDRKTNNNELSALISLLDEPSEPIFGRIKEKLIVYGPEAIPHLEDAWDNTFENIIQSRIEDIIHSIQFNALLKDLAEWRENNQFDLFKGYYLLSSFAYPDLKEQDLKDKLELIKRDIWLELNSTLTALEKVKVINHIIFDVYGFSGNKVNVDAPTNFFLNTLLETRKGNHLSIGIIYMIISQKLGIPIFGVDLPQHFVLSYVDEIHDELITVVNENEVLFYINPFNNGAVFTKKEIEVFINHMKIKPENKYFKPCSNKQILIRMMDSLITTYGKLGQEEKTEELKKLMAVLKG
ncbi:MAG: transglutaminase-like domain-containing protein [Bacteroidales bacterium]|nr:transglutaminase-like domain-containing protein [Bacteroidales bacterium]MCF8402509.1 transglutaminase-like domain-containing protein [Bacteroidales bacterium]